MTPATQTLDLHAPALGRDYRIMMQPPASGAEPRAVLFVLDGNIYQPVMAQMTLLRSMGHEIVPVLVVGIGYPEDDPEAWMSRRTLDLTPCAPSQFMPHDSQDPADWGGLDISWTSSTSRCIRGCARLIRWQRPIGCCSATRWAGWP